MQPDLPEYRYAENPDDDSMGAIRITNGKFKGFVYQYGVVSFSESEDISKLSLIHI